MDDIQPLAEYFAMHYAKLFQKYFWKITEPVMECLKQYSWPGNVRELENVVEFMVNMMGSYGILDEKTLPREVREWGEKKKLEEEQKPGVEAEPVRFDDIRRTINIERTGVPGDISRLPIES